MLEPHFDRLRAEVGDAVRQPDFTTVRRRAGQVRRRRTATASAVFLATVLTATGLGYAVQNRPDHRTAPVTSDVPDDSWPRMTSTTATGKDLYGLLQRCRDCDPELYASPDAGASWQRRTEPPEPQDAGTPRDATLLAVAPGTVAWREGRTVPVAEALDPASPATPDRWWITSDGARTWRPVTTGTQPVTTVPAGSRPVDCDLLPLPACRVGALDPATGRTALLAHQPTGITIEGRWTSQTTVPLGGRLWVPGLDPVTNKPAVATSADAGRTWHTHVFTAAAPAAPGHGAAARPYVAAGPGATAYVLTARAADVVDAYYTTDGGLTWAAGDTIRDARPSGAFVAADGSHIVATGTGFVAGRGTGRYTPVTLPGYPGQSAQIPQITSRPAAEPYLLPAETGPYLSRDGRTWRHVPRP